MFLVGWGDFSVKKHLFSLLSIAVMACALAPASFAADDEYFVEIGDDVQKDDAQAQWQALVNKNKTLLGKLKLYPKDVMQDGKQVATRMQAGPITSKVQAIKICNKLFAKDVPCFVIEGVNAPPTAMAHLKDSKQIASSGGGILPWLTGGSSASADTEVKDIPAPPAVKGEDTAIDGSPRSANDQSSSVKGKVTLPWLEAKKSDPWDGEDSEKQEAEKEKAKKKAEVQVAEAIRVPLTETHDLEDQIHVNSLPELKPSFGTHKLQDQSAEMGNVNSGAGWLDVGNFASEEIASSMWDEVRAANKKQAKTLNMRISKPASGSGNTTLSVGPFANSAEALNFCRNGLQAAERGLQCGFVANDAGIANGKLLALNQRADAYAKRRKPVQNPDVQTASVAANVAKLAPASGPSKQYWVQVVKADSQMQALKQWDELKRANAEVIGDLRSSVSAAATDKSSYVVRVGPILENDQAIRVCSQLQKRNVDCRVLLYSRGA